MSFESDIPNANEMCCLAQVDNMGECIAGALGELRGKHCKDAISAMQVQVASCSDVR